ncbi:hypothetical protein Tco_0766541 [Tanacetum coccineum]
MRMGREFQSAAYLLTVVEEYADVFAIPKELPPSRLCDHRIPLLEGTKGTTAEIMDAYGGVLNFSQGVGNINVHKLVKSCRLEPIINPLAITAMNLDLKSEWSEEFTKQECSSDGKNLQKGSGGFFMSTLILVNMGNDRYLCVAVVVMVSMWLSSILRKVSSMDLAFLPYEVI